MIFKKKALVILSETASCPTEPHFGIVMKIYSLINDHPLDSIYSLMFAVILYLNLFCSETHKKEKAPGLWSRLVWKRSLKYTLDVCDEPPAHTD